MKCSNCKNELKEGAKFCSKCGQKVVESPDNPQENKTNAEKETTVVESTNQASTFKGSNSFAITGFVISLVSTILCCGSLNWLSLVFSIIGLVKSKELDGDGKGLAIAGIIISAIALVLGIIFGIISASTNLINEVLKTSSY